MQDKRKPYFEHFNRHIGEHAIVLGNGPSRSNVDFAAAVDDAVMIGCNAIYRDWLDLDYIVSVDHNVPGEWGRFGPWDGVECFTCWGFLVNWVRVWQPNGKRSYISGSYGILLAAYMGCSVIWVVGFDMDGRNLYHGTENYHGRAVDHRDAHNYKRLKGEIEELLRPSGMAFPRVLQVGRHTIEWAENVEMPEEWKAMGNVTP